MTSQDFVQKIQNEMNLMYANSYDFNQMKSTLLLCAICKNNYIIGHIGDGAVLCFGKDSYVISPPQENEVGGTEPILFWIIMRVSIFNSKLEK